MERSSFARVDGLAKRDATERTLIFGFGLLPAGEREELVRTISAIWDAAELFYCVAV